MTKDERGRTIQSPKPKIPNCLPRLALIADGFTDEGVATRATEAARAGVPWVHLRDHEAGEVSFGEKARALAARLREAAPANLRLSVNSRLRVAEALGADFHTGRHGSSAEGAREQLPSRALVGVSAHGRSEAEAARGAADYFFFSPVFPTRSKPGHPGAGRGALQAVCEAVSETPVLALGGVTPGRVAACREAGAHGVAVCSGILHADAPTDATRAYLKALPSE